MIRFSVCTAAGRRYGRPNRLHPDRDRRSRALAAAKRTTKVQQTPTTDQIDLAARGAAWADMVGVALANNVGPLSGQVVNFLEDAAQGTVPLRSVTGRPTSTPAFRLEDESALLPDQIDVTNPAGVVHLHCAISCRKSGRRTVGVDVDSNDWRKDIL